MHKPVLSPAFKQRLATHNPIGMSLSTEDVDAWFHVIWPKYAEYQYKNHQRAIAKWWSKVTEREIQDCREASRRRKAAVIAERVDQSESSRPAVNFFSAVVGKDCHS